MQCVGRQLGLAGGSCWRQVAVLGSDHNEQAPFYERCLLTVGTHLQAYAPP